MFTGAYLRISIAKDPQYFIREACVLLGLSESYLTVQHYVLGILQESFFVEQSERLFVSC